MPRNSPPEASHLVSRSALRQRAGARLKLCVMDLLHGIHATVSFGEQCFHVIAVFGAEGRAHAQGDDVTTTRMPSCFNCCLDRKSTRLNSSHPSISYAVFCL